MFKVSDPKGFDTLMQSPHFLRVEVRLMTLAGTAKSDLTEQFMDGMITVDSAAQVTRALDLTIFDPDRKVSLDPNMPSRTGVFIADVVKVRYIIESPDRLKSFDIPVFTGVIDDVDRDDVFIKIKALGKERLSLGNSWTARTYKKGQLKTGVIKSILLDEIGEASCSVPTAKAKLAADTKLNREKSPWVVAKSLASTLNRYLMYDADGTPVARVRSQKSTFKFTDKNVTSNPKISYDLSQVVNIVQVVGQTTGKSKKKITVTVKAANGHPLSPVNLGLPGKPRYLWEVIEDTNYTSIAECKAVANRRLAQGLLAGVDVQFTGIPNPRLQEGDIVSIDVNGVQATWRIRKFTIPLTAGVDASYGYLKSMKPTANPGRGRGQKSTTTVKLTSLGTKKKGKRR